VPAFVQLKEVTVDVGGQLVPIGQSSLRYLRRTVDDLDDPETPGYDGINGSTRKYLLCKSNRWTMGAQMFSVDVLMRGLHTGDDSLVDAGLEGLDWGVRVPVNEKGVHRLHRSCDNTTTEDFGGTHHTTQWLAALGTAVHVLANAPSAARWQAHTDRYIARIEELATLLVDEENSEHWEEHWLVDGNDNIFTHKAYMRAAALAMAASVTEDDADAARWASEAAKIARRGVDAQRADGVNPERGGYDVSYQMYGTWLAILYWSILAPDEPMRAVVQPAIERAIDWMEGRVDLRTGQIEIGESTRTCSEIDGNQEYEAADAVRVFLLWGHLQGRADLIADAVRIDSGTRRPGNPCPK
jgi:hypothetical protein